MTNQERVAEARKAIRCLYIAVDESVARDVNEKVEAALSALISEGQGEVAGWVNRVELDANLAVGGVFDARFWTFENEDADTPLFLAPPSDEAREAKLMQFFETVFRDQWDMADGGDLQDTAEALGLLVRVPADEQFKDEWGADEMLVWSWHPIAKLDGKEEG